MSKILIDDFNYIYKNNNANNFFKNKKILITGASGFLGSYFSYYFFYKFKNLKLHSLFLNDIKISNDVFLSLAMNDDNRAKIENGRI